MKKPIIRPIVFSIALVCAGTSVVLAQEPSPSSKEKEDSTLQSATTVAVPDAKVSTAASAETAVSAEKKTSEPPNEAEMMKQMMELSKTGENHKLLANMVGNWAYTVKMWMNPSGSPTTSNGSAVIKSVLDGRYFVGDFTGKFQMPGTDGKMKDMNFKGMSIDGYDNVKQKFFSTWIDNMGTGIMMSEGVYDAGNKTFTYMGEFEAMPGMKTKVRMTVKIADKDHHTFEWYEDRGTGESKTMEINYTRKK